MTKESIHDVFRQALQLAREVRAERLPGDGFVHFRDVYAVCFYLARALHGTHPDVRLMIGDWMQDSGGVQHHWIELPKEGVYVDPVYDQVDPFRPIRVGRVADEEFRAMYRNRIESGFRVDDPRDFPENVFRPRTAYGPEGGAE